MHIKLLAWYSFGMMVLAILYWVPTFLSGQGEWETGLWVLALFSPIALYLFQKAKEE